MVKGKWSGYTAGSLSVSPVRRARSARARHSSAPAEGTTVALSPARGRRGQLGQEGHGSSDGSERYGALDRHRRRRGGGSR